LVFSMASVLFLALGMRWDRKDLLRNGYYAVYAFFLTTVVSSAVLLQAFLKKDFGFGYVAENSDASLSTFYRIAGFWAGQQGSFLLWLLLIAVVAVVIALVNLNKVERLTGGAVMVMCVIGAVFAALMVLDKGSKPFLAAEPGTQPFGLNPLLLHPAMVLHPPALFIGYVGLSVPFAFGISTLLLGRGDKLWVTLSQRWAVAGWLFLSLGVGLGAWWAYVVLSFGGYWGWDPVESTSLVPWLTATALLHAFTLYKSRGLFRHWALGLAAATFWFTILATWTTRTGLIQSVHAFEKNPLLVWILSGLLVVTAAATAGLVAWRWRRFQSHDQVESIVSRDFLYYLTNLLLTLFAVAVAFTTVAVPLLMNKTVGPSTFNAIAQPLGVVMLALIAICPLLAWRKTEGAELRKTLILPLVTAVLSVPLWLYLGFQSNVWGFIGLLVCGFAVGAVIQFVLRSARRAAGPGKSLWSGMGRAFTGSRTRTAAYFVHFGMILVVAGLIGSNVYKHEETALVKIKAGQTASIAGYTLTYKGMKGNTGPQSSTRSIATFDVSRGGTQIGTLAPHTDVYPASGAAVRAVILGRPFEDLFVVADEPFDSTSKEIALRMVIFPLVRWVWIGSILLCVGAAVSLWPKTRRQEQEVLATAPTSDADGRLDGASA
ncbi:MAG TPA: cytochrome c-type biogenesis CcmF C-terminal domain-containing protein, partial [Solirubrobacterales bacterium]|nr:cytochrome c-type biogenesis CcmF C-terminal domain-containing protein [Solirubrobacterales bacterium]